MSLPEGWTDDMSIVVPRGLTIDEVVDLVLTDAAAGIAYDATLARLVERGVSEDDAALAYDRALGGLVRAATGSPANEPDRSKDPIAWTSYQRCVADVELIAAIRPEFAEAARSRR
jgi:hypothetical protein